MGFMPTRNTKFSASLRRTGVISIQATLLASAGISAAAAQVVVPTQVNPAQVEKRFEPKQSPLPPSNLKTPAPAEQSGMSKQMEEQLSKKRFVLKSVSVEGSTVYSPDKLKSTYGDLIGKEISLLDAQKIAKRITAMYHSDQYILSQAVLPPQDIRDGKLKIRVVEGYISNVIFEGKIKQNSSRKLVQSYGENLTNARPVRTADMERYLLLLNDLPGSGAKGLVRPAAKKPGTAEMVVTMDHKPFDASYTLDNRGTKTVGPWQHTGTVTANSLFGLYDRTLLRIITTAPTTELRFFDLQHEEQLGSEGTRLVLDASHSRTAPGDFLKYSDIRGKSTFLQAKLFHPFVRSRQENLTGRAIFDARNTDTDVFSDTHLNTDKLRVVRAGGSYDFADPWYGVNLIDAQVSRGLNIFDATNSGTDRSNSNGAADFTKFNLDISRTQPLPHNFSLFTAASGQYSCNSLLAAEQYTVGGVGFGQAYDPAELSGDNGIAGKAELRYGQTLGDYYINAYQLYGYYDIGRVWSRDLGPGGNDKKSLASAGFGLRTNFSPNLSSNLEVGVPLTKPANNQGGHANSPRLFFTTTARF